MFSRLYEGVPIAKPQFERIIVKAKKEDRRINTAVGIYLKNMSPDAFASLCPEETKRALQIIIVEGIRRKDDILIVEAMNMLKPLNEEALVYIRAVVYDLPHLVSGLVARYCERPKMARRELIEAAQHLINDVRSGVRGSVYLAEAVDCLAQSRPVCKFEKINMPLSDTRTFALAYRCAEFLRTQKGDGSIWAEQTIDRLRRLLPPEPLHRILSILDREDEETQRNMKMS